MQRVGGHIADVAAAAGAGRTVEHGDGARLHVDAAAAGGADVARSRLRQGAAGEQAQAAARSCQCCVQRQVARCRLQPDVAAAGRQRVTGRCARVEAQVTGRAVQDDVASAAGRQVFLRDGGRATGAARYAGVAANAVDCDRERVNAGAVALGDIQATGTGVGAQGRDGGLDVVGAAANAGASLEDQAGRGDVGFAVASRIAVNNVAAGGRDADAGRSGCQQFKRHIPTCQQQDVAVAAGGAEGLRLRDVTHRHQVNRLGAGAGQNVGVLQNVLTGTHADVAARIRDVRAQRDVRCAASGLHQHIARNRDGAATRQGRDAASSALQHEGGARADVALCRIAGLRRRRAVAQHLVDVDGAQGADLDVVGFAQEQPARSRARNARCQFGNADLQRIGGAASTVATGCAGGDDAQLIGADIAAVGAAGGTRVADSRGAQADIARGADRAELHRCGRHNAHIAAAGVQGRTVGHGQRPGAHVNRCCASAEHVGRGRHRRGAANQHADIAAAGIDIGVQGQRPIDVLHQHIATARCRDSRIHRQRSRHVGAVAQHDGAVRGRRQASQRRGVGNGRCGAHSCDPIDRHRGHAADDQTVVFRKVQATTGAGIGRHRVHTQFNCVGAAADTGASAQSHAIGRDVDGLRPRIGIGVADGASSNQAHHPLVGSHSTARVQLPQHQVGAGLDAHGAIGADESGCGTHCDVAGRGQHING